MGRHVVDAWEAAVIYLLVSAHFVQLYDLDSFRILKFCHPRIVEGDMAVFANTQAHNIHRILLQDPGVAGAFRRSIRRGGAFRRSALP